MCLADVSSLQNALTTTIETSRQLYLSLMRHGTEKILSWWMYSVPDRYATWNLTVEHIALKPKHRCSGMRYSVWYFQLYKWFKSLYDVLRSYYEPNFSIVCHICSLTHCTPTNGHDQDSTFGYHLYSKRRIFFFKLIQFFYVTRLLTSAIPVRIRNAV